MKTKGNKVKLGSYAPFIYRDKANAFNLLFRSYLLDTKILVSQWLYEIRTSQMCLTREEVGRKLNISASNVRYIECGYGTSIDAVYAIYAYYAASGVLLPDQHLRFMALSRMVWRMGVY